MKSIKIMDSNAKSFGFENIKNIYVYKLTASPMNKHQFFDGQKIQQQKAMREGKKSINPK